MKNDEKKLKVVSRKSKLAQLQVTEIIELLRASVGSLQIEEFFLDSYGDKNKEISLMDNPPADIFTREIDIALLNDEADFSVHSAKDLPYPLHRDLEIVAITKRADATDALVTRDGLKLSELPSYAVIATSSKTREREIKALRNDIVVRPVRGTIQERISQIKCGKFDGVIVATCALKRLGLENEIAEILPIETHDLQGTLAVVAKKSRIDMKALFSKIDYRNSYGRVFLAGAGVGDAENVSIKVMKALQMADVVYYDRLLSQDLLEFTKGEKIAVGKHKGDQIKTQEETNRLIYLSAISGKNVVRLKGGDPMIFGRGGEEAEYLLSRLVDVDVLPGITSASAAGSIYNIPITMRNEARSISFVTAHTAAPEICIGDIEVPNTATIVYYMSITRVKLLKDQLLKNGRDKGEAVAFVSNIGRLNETFVVSTINEMDSVSVSMPAIIIVGDVVNHYRCQERILYTGISTENIYKLTKGKVIHYPVIKAETLEVGVLPGGLKDLTDYEAIIFTSRNSVNAFVQHYGINTLFKKMIISIGDFTTKEINKFGADIDFVSGVPNSESLDELVSSLNLKCFYPCSDLSHNKLHNIDGVTSQVLYKTIRVKRERVDAENYDSIFFSSPSTVDAFLDINDSIPEGKLIYVMGIKTLAKVKSKGVKEERIINVQEIQTK